jgi:hypothetical protein
VAAKRDQELFLHLVIGIEEDDLFDLSALHT